MDENTQEISGMLAEVADVLRALAVVLRALAETASGSERRVPGEVSPDDPACFAVDWQAPPTVRNTSLQEGKRKFDRAFSKNPARAGYLANAARSVFRPGSG